MSIEPSQGFAFLRQYLVWRNTPDCASVRVSPEYPPTSEEALRAAFIAAGVVNANIPAILVAMGDRTDRWTDVGKPFEFSGNASFQVAEVEIEGLVARMRVQTGLLRAQGRATSPEELGQILAKSGVSYGVDHAKLAEMAASPQDGWVEVARGTEPVHGTDAEVECLVKLDDIVLPSPADDGSVDFRDRGRLPEVTEGTALYVRRPGIEAVDGKDLSGRVIPARKAKDAKLSPPTGCRFRVNDPDTVEAGCDGYLFRGRDGHIHVGDVFKVKGDLDLSVGNIKYHGAVEIGGNVPAGFQIQAGGNVVIQGTAESASISSDRGFIQVRGGVFGGELKAATDIHLAFAHDATIECGGTLEPGKYLQHCKVRCGVLRFQRGGILVGGDVLAAQEIDVDILGTSAGTPTRARVAILEEEDAKQDLERLTIEEKKLAMLRDILEPKVMAVRQRLASGGQLLGRAREDAEETLRQYSGVVERARQIEKRRQTCMEIISAERVREGAIIIRRDIFPGAELFIFGKHVPIEQVNPPVRLSIKDDEVDIRRA